MSAQQTRNTIQSKQTRKIAFVLVQCRRRWAKIEIAHGQSLLLDGIAIRYSVVFIFIIFILKLH